MGINLAFKGLSRPLVPHIESWEPRGLTKVPDGPQAYTPNILRLQEEGAKVVRLSMSE